MTNKEGPVTRPETFSFGPGDAIRNHESKQQLDADVIKSELAQPKRLSEMPVMRILKSQLDKNQEDIIENHPGLPQQIIALSLAQRFNSIDAYKRVTEQPGFGLKEHEFFDSPKEIEPLLSKLQIELRQAALDIRSTRSNARIDFDNGWLYVIQGQRNETSHRIYLSPAVDSMAEIFHKLALAIPENVAYQMKTIDIASGATGKFGSTRSWDLARIDKIVLYASEDSLSDLLNAVNKVHTDNRAAFTGRPAPGGGSIAPLSGVSIGLQPQKHADQEITGSMTIAQRLEETLAKATEQRFLDEMKGHPNTESAFRTTAAEYLWAALTKEGDRLYWSAFSTEEAKELSQCYMQAIWYEAIKSSLNGQPKLPSSIEDTFFQYLKRTNLKLSPEQQSRLRGEPRLRDASAPDGLTSKIYRRAILTAGMALAFNAQLANGDLPSNGLTELISRGEEVSQDRLVMIDGIYPGKELERLALKSLVYPGTADENYDEVYFETESGNIYAIWRLPNGQYGLANAESNRGKGSDLRGQTLDTADLEQLILERGKPFIYKSSSSTIIKSIIGLRSQNISQSSEGSSQTRPKQSDIRQRFRAIIQTT